MIAPMSPLPSQKVIGPKFDSARPNHRVVEAEPDDVLVGRILLLQEAPIEVDALVDR